MSIFALARRPPQWLRVALVALLLAFALNTIAHVTHTHDGLAGHSLVCANCLSFGHLADTPQPARVVLEKQFAEAIVPTPALPVISARPLLAARPRAPPTT